MERILLLPLILLPATAVQAASFDCSKASTKIEKMVCGDTELSKLDEELNTAYLSVIQDEVQTKAVRHNQKEWLKVRDGCPDRGCIKKAYQSRIAQLALGENVRNINGADNPLCIKVKNGYVRHIEFSLMNALRPDPAALQFYDKDLARADVDNNGHLENIVKVHGYRGSYETSYLATTDNSRTRLQESRLNETLKDIGATDLYILDGATYVATGGDVRSIYKVEHENADLVCRLQRYTSFSEGL